ncbi:MAG: hypothetical protein FWF31_08775 [Desulfobulbus sp.]|nr:hypothetical protein [Desulfobulbus sp.]
MPTSMPAGAKELTDSVLSCLLPDITGRTPKATTRALTLLSQESWVGVNRPFDQGLAGLHTAVVHHETSNRSDGSAHSRADSLHLGIQGNLLPHEGFFIHGLASASLEKIPA